MKVELVYMNGGWNLNRGKVLYGPAMKVQCLDYARENRYDVEEMPIMLDGLKEGTLFQTSEGWYRLVSVEPEGFRCTNCASGQSTLLPSDTQVLAISIVNTR